MIKLLRLYGGKDMLLMVIEKLKKFRFTVPSLILTNALLFFMMMASSFVKTTGLTIFLQFPWDSAPW